jgi:hypothetical protein
MLPLPARSDTITISGAYAPSCNVLENAGTVPLTYTVLAPASNTANTGITAVSTSFAYSIGDRLDEVVQAVVNPDIGSWRIDLTVTTDRVIVGVGGQVTGSPGICRAAAHSGKAQAIASGGRGGQFPQEF